jgi:hypothetical protein
MAARYGSRAAVGVASAHAVNEMLLPPPQSAVHHDSAYNPAYIRILPRTSSLSVFRKSCETCGVEHDGSFGAGRFCSSRCARTVGGLAHRKKRLAERILATPAHHQPLHHYPHHHSGILRANISAGDISHVQSQRLHTPLTGAVAKRPPSYHHQARSFSYNSVAAVAASSEALIGAQTPREIQALAPYQNAPTYFQDHAHRGLCEVAPKARSDENISSRPANYAARVPTSPVSSPVTPTYGPSQNGASGLPRISVSSLLNPTPERTGLLDPSL